MKAGETLRYDCEECSVEFEVTLEPKCKDDKKAAAKIDEQTVTNCPFCGSELGTDDDEE